MLEIRQKNLNIWNLPKNNEAVCFTTNGIVKPNGLAVVGAGIAKQANQIFHIDKKLGSYITQYGNRVFNLGQYQRGEDIFRLISFPTKHHYKEDSDITLICRSAEQLVELCDKFGVTKCYLPPVGCGCGKLNYENTVRPWISMILDDRFIVVLSQ